MVYQIALGTTKFVKYDNLYHGSPSPRCTQLGEGEKGRRALVCFLLLGVKHFSSHRVVIDASHRCVPLIPRPLLPSKGRRGEEI